MEENERIPCADCAERFESRPAQRRHEVEVHLQWSRAPRGVGCGTSGSAPMLAERWVTSSPRGAATPYGTSPSEGPGDRMDPPGIGDRGPAEDPVEDRSGRAPNPRA